VKQTLGHICEVVGDTVRFPTELLDQLSQGRENILFVVNPDTKVIHTTPVEDNKVVKFSISSQNSKNFAKITNFLTSDTPEVNILFCHGDCTENKCLWEGYFRFSGNVPHRLEELEKALVKKIDDANITIKEVSWGETDVKTENTISIGIIESVKNDVVTFSNPAWNYLALKKHRHVLSVLNLRTMNMMLRPLSIPEVIYLNLTLENLPEVIAETAMAFSELGIEPLFTTGVCMQEKECFWEGYIDPAKTDIYLEGRQKSEGIIEEIKKALRNVKGIKNVEHNILQA
jgi:hypothetical protein